MLSDHNAEFFISETHRPIFKDDSPGRPAWQAMEPGAVKHDTFVYSRTGERVLLWDASSNSFSEWENDIRKAVQAQGLD